MADKTIKIILAILFFICLADLPYGYYQFVRFLALVGFVFLAYQSYENNDKSFAFVYVCLAILFQPFLKILFGREIWNVIDIVVGIGLIASIFLKSKTKGK